MRLRKILFGRVRVVKCKTLALIKSLERMLSLETNLVQAHLDANFAPSGTYSCSYASRSQEFRMNSVTEKLNHVQKS